MLKYELAHISGPIIKKLRKEKRMTQKQLADLMNVSRAVVANWEAQMRAPTTEQFCRLASIFNVSTEFLVGRVNNNSSINTTEMKIADITQSGYFDNKNISLIDTVSDKGDTYLQNDFVIDMNKLNSVGKNVMLKIYRTLLEDKLFTKE